MHAFKRSGRQLARNFKSSTSTATKYRKNNSGDFDDMGNEALARTYHTDRLARRGLLDC